MNTPPSPSASSLATRAASLPAPVRRALAHLGSVFLGAFAALVLHYVLYRIGLPLEPFIYVAF
jgi:hypothetical protein